MDPLNFINELKKNRQKLILAAVIACAVVIFDVSFVMKAQVRSIGSLGKKISTLKKEMQGFKKDMALMRKTEQQQVQTENIKLYTLNEKPLLIQDIYSYANENQIDVIQAVPPKEVKKQEQEKVKRAKGKSAPKTEQKTEGFVSVEIKLDLACTYHNLGAFLNRLEMAEQPLFAEDLRIIRDSGNYLKLNASMTLRTYVKK
jgi:Tfp pilus assembly protein PilO